MSIQILPRPIQICYVRSIAPMLFFVWCWEVSAARGMLLSSTVRCMPALKKKYAVSVLVACMSESRNVLVAILSTKPRLILKPDNAMKSSESRKNRMTEYQAHKTALESMDQSQVCLRAGF